MNKISDENIRKIHELGKAGCTNNYISKLLRIDRGTVSKYLKQINITKGQKYIVDHHYFDEIDTEGKAYFLGLLFADGCNY